MGVSINGTHSDTWGLILTDFDISAPAVKTKFIPIEGRSGDIDISEAYGEPKYENRTVALKFVLAGSINQTLIDDIVNEIHGQRCNIIFDHDPNYYYSGRVSVSWTQKDQENAEITVAANCDPYKYKLNVTEETFIIAKNLVVNGNFDSIEDWTPTFCTLSVDSNVMSLTGTKDAHTIQQGISNQENDHIYYTRAFVMTEETNCSYLFIEHGDIYTIQEYPTADTWYELSVYGTTEFSSVKFAASYSSTPAGTRVMKVKKALCIDLTAIYGAGNEPSKSVFDGYMAEFTNKYFEHANLTDLQETVDLTNDRQTAYPIVSTDAACDITLDGITYSFAAVQDLQSAIPLKEGVNELVCVGNGEIKFVWQEGAL